MKRRLPRSLAEAAWQELHEEIITLQLKPGTPLVLSEQAQRLGMSIMPIREAISKLQMEGLVSQEPQRGATVAPLSITDLEDVYRVRVELEGLAVRRAATMIGPADRERLENILGQYGDAYMKGDERVGRDFHRQFHLMLYATGKSPTLNRLIPPLFDNSERYRVLSLYDAARSVEDRLKGHRAILEACWSHDAEAAGRLVVEHLERTVQSAKARIAEFSLV